MVASLSRSARTAIEKQIDDIFDRLIFSFLGPTPKFQSMEAIYTASYNPYLSLPGIYFSSMEATGKPAVTLESLRAMIRVASNYLDALRNSTKAKVINSLEAELANHQTGYMKGEFEKVTTEIIKDIFTSVGSDLKMVLSSESTKAKNIASLEAIASVAKDMGDSDPTVFFAVTNDKKTCQECKRLHLLDDLITPQVWKLSEIKHSYHKRGQGNPSVHGLHPHCRCFLHTLSQGYGFGEDGRIRFVGVDHDEYVSQQKT